MKIQYVTINPENLSPDRDGELLVEVQDTQYNPVTDTLTIAVALKKKD